MPKVNAFMQSGGYIVWHGLTPSGLGDYNKIVGFNHMIRAMRRERVSLSTPRNSLTSGLTLGDVVMLSGERIFPWTADEYVADDIFSHIVDYDEVAPFGTSDNGLFPNAVNGFVGADGWKLINDFEAPKAGPARLVFTFPQSQTISEFVWDGSVNYNATTKVGLTIDGKTQSWSVPANGEPQTLSLKPNLRGKKIELQIHDWARDKSNSNGGYTIGIDNIWLKAQRSPDFYRKVRPMLNVGGLMHYPRGNGGMVLCNLLFKETEAVPINTAKKRTIFSAILRNLNAPFAGGKTVIAGAGLKYVPIDIHNQATQYRTERGWFGDANFTFNGLPRGRQKFGGIEYSIYDFPTSPVPTAIMLGGDNIPNNPPREVRGIPVNQKADALFFLHTARIDNRMSDDDRKNNRRFEMARYIVNYVDGQSATVPIYSEMDIEDYKQATPRAVPGAQIAWVSAYPSGQFSAVAYSKQWNNPRPGVAIKSIDMTYGAEPRGVPVLLAVTAASAP
jgi:beta-galactosidase